MAIILIIPGFIFLIKGADFLVNGASSIARRYNVSDLVIGLTVVAFGTSLPELFVNIIASIEGDTGIAIGNILGSNTANVMLILGISSIIAPLTVTIGTVWKEIPLSLLAALLLAVLANDHLIDRVEFSTLTRIDGLVLIAFFIVFIYYSFSIAKRINGLNEHVSTRQLGIAKSSIFIIIGLLGLGIGAKWIVNGAMQLTVLLRVSQSFIGLTIVALGTSLPELATSATAAYKKNTEIAVGNIVGSNIFNIFFILGISAIINPIPFKLRSNFDIGVLIFSNILLFTCMFAGKRHIIERWKGTVFTSLYVIYIISLIIMR